VTDDRELGSRLEERDLRQLARALSAVLGDLHALVEDETEESLAARLGGHLGEDPRALPVLSHDLPSYQLNPRPAVR
jgi:hypothetical protein